MRDFGRQNRTNSCAANRERRVLCLTSGFGCFGFTFPPCLLLDITPVTVYEQATVIPILMLSALIYATIFGNMAYAMETITSTIRRYQSRMDSVKVRTTNLTSTCNEERGEAKEKVQESAGSDDCLCLCLFPLFPRFVGVHQSVRASS